MALNNIKIILFDLGGVIINLYPERTFRAFANLAKTSEEEVLMIYEDAEYFKHHEKGLIDDELFRDKLRKSLTIIIADNELDSAWNAMLGEIPSDRIATIEQLKKGYKCMVLSNTNSIHEQHFHQQLSSKHGLSHLSELFDQVFFSHEINERKPEVEVFEIIVDRCGVQPNEILFLDDSELNVEMAERVGMHGLHIPRNQGFSVLLQQKLKHIAQND